MPTPFEVSMHARWPDMDQNGHMRTVAYLEIAEDSRMQYFASRGYSMDSFAKNRIGPVVTSDELQYRAELRLLDRAAVRLELAGLSPGGGRFRLRNTFVRADGRTAAKPSPRRSAGSTSARAASPRRRRASGSSSPTCHTPTTSPSSRRSRPAEGRLLDPPAPA